MKRTLAFAFAIAFAFALAALAGACGGKELDLGGHRPGDALDGSTSGTGVDAGSWPVAAQRNARSLRSEGPYLYWIASQSGIDEIRRCEKVSCASTVVPLVKISSSLGLATVEIRGDTIYAVHKGGILSCPVSGCSSPTVIVTGVQPVAVAFDESKVYWSQRSDVNSKIYTCPLTGCEKGTPIVATDAIDIAVDATRIYWIVGDVSYPRNPTAVMSAPKDGSAAPTMLAAHQNQAASLVLHDEFVYWVTSYTVGTVARCPVGGCPSDGPELLSRDQYFPHFVNPDGDALFWMNGASAPDKPSSVERPVQILRCQLSNCASSTEVLDEGLGGGYGVRAAATWKSFEAVSFPPREMVVDSEAIYWFADVVNAAVAGAPLGPVVDGSISRTERRR